MSTIASTTTTFRMGNPTFGSNINVILNGYRITGTGFTNFSNSGTIPTVTGVTIIVDATAKSVVFRSTTSGAATSVFFIVDGEWDDSGWTYNWVDGCNGLIVMGPGARWRSGSAILGQGGFTMNTRGNLTGGDYRSKSIVVDEINGVAQTYAGSGCTVNWYGVKYTHNGTVGSDRGDFFLVFPVGVSGNVVNFTAFYDTNSLSHTCFGGPTTMNFNNIISWNALWNFSGPYRALTPATPINNYITFFDGDAANFSKMAPAGALTVIDKVTYFNSSKNTTPFRTLGSTIATEQTQNRSVTPVLFNGYRFLTFDGTTSTLTNLYSNTGHQFWNLGTGFKYDIAYQSRLNLSFIDTFNNNINDVKVSVLNGSNTDSTRTRYVPSYRINNLASQDNMAVSLIQDITATGTNSLVVTPADIYCYTSTSNTSAYVNFSTGTVTNSLSPLGVGFDYIGSKIAYAKRWGYYDYSYSWTPTQDNPTRNVQATFVRDPYIKTTNLADEATANISNISLTDNGTNYTAYTQNTFITGDYIDGNQFYMKAVAHRNADDQRPKNDFNIVSGELTFNGATNISLWNPPTVWTPTTGLEAVNAIKTSGTYTRTNTAAYSNQKFCKITAKDIVLSTFTTNRTDLVLNTSAGSGYIRFTGDTGATTFTISDGGSIIAGNTSSNYFWVPRYVGANRTYTIQNCKVGGYFLVSPGNSQTIENNLNLTNITLESNLTINRNTDSGDGYRYGILNINLKNINYNGYTISIGNDFYNTLYLRNPWSVTVSGTENVPTSAIKVNKIFTDTAVNTNKQGYNPVVTGGSGTGLPLTFTANVLLNRNKSFVAYIDGFEPITIFTPSTSEDSVITAAVSIASDNLNFTSSLSTADLNIINNSTVTCTGTGVNQKTVIGIPSTVSYTQPNIGSAKLMIRRIQELATQADDYHYKLARGTFTNLITYQTYGYQVKANLGTFTVEKITSNDIKISMVLYIVNQNNILYEYASSSTDIQKYIVFLLASPGAVLLLTEYDRETIAQFSTDALQPTLNTMNNNIGVVNENVKDTSILVPASRNITTL